VIYVGIVLCVATPFLLLFGESIAARIFSRIDPRQEDQ